MLGGRLARDPQNNFLPLAAVVVGIILILFGVTLAMNHRDSSLSDEYEGTVRDRSEPRSMPNKRDLVGMMVEARKSTKEEI